ncbi:MAG TPA: toast rack family protein, partial [Longimicrobiales bacterium]|nr:toast rack family protein [Longimicrobiales bacterium]
MFKAIAMGIAFAIGTASPAFSQDWRTITSLRQMKNEQSLDVSVEYGAGKLFISPGEGNALYKATLRYDADHFKPLTSYNDGRLRVGIEGGSVKSHNVKAGRLDLSLNTHVPVDLDLKFGAGTANVELGGIRIREAH